MREPWQTGTRPALKAPTAVCFVTVHSARPTVKIQRGDRVSTGLGVCVFVCESMCVC